MISVLKEKYLMEHEDAELLSSFLVPMMHYYPDSRATAAELVNHPWLKDVVVQGEVEMHYKELERLKRINELRDSTSETTGPDLREDNNRILGGQPLAGLRGMGRI